MKTATAVMTLALIWSAVVCRADSGESTAISADGLIQFDPPQAVSCIAVRVEVPEGKMVTGLRWYNGTGAEAFPRILVASGNDFQPPAYGQAVVIAQNVQGQDHAWSAVTFNDPIASQSGTLFIVIEYPQNYAPQSGQPALGVGYANVDADRHYFVTGDGNKWFKVTSRYQVLLEPVLVDREPGVVSLRAPQEPGRTTRQGLFAAPNPFNPETRIELNLPAAASGYVRIVDLRGRIVAELHQGPLVQGANSFVWQGLDSGGRPVASGVYWVLAQTSDQKYVRKLLLVK